MGSRLGYCRPCDAQVHARGRGVGWWLALAATSVGMVLLVLGASLIGPFVMFALPFMALFGFALGPLARLVSEPPTCPRCHRELRWRHRDEVPPELRARDRARQERRAAA
jgi:hypothetical protein